MLLRLFRFRIAARMLPLIAVAAVPLHSGASVDDCLNLSGSAGVTACAEHANSIKSDQVALKALAERLEQSNKIAKAFAVYELAYNTYPRSRSFTKGYIRLRREAKAATLIDNTNVSPSIGRVAHHHSVSPPVSEPRPASIAEKAPAQVVSQPNPQPQSASVDPGGTVLADRPQQSTNATELCHVSRWQTAKNWCGRAINQDPANASLHERYADVLKSMGQTIEALKHYAIASELEPDNRSIARKRTSLDELLGPNPASLIASQQQTTASTSQADRPPPSKLQATQRTVSGSDDLVALAKAPPLVQKLELLQDIYARQLIEKEEYERRRAKLLSQEFGAPEQAVTGALVPSSKGKYRALIVGNDNYKNFVRLRSPGNDARVVEAVLRNRYGFETETLINATRYEILGALSKLRRDTNENDSVLIYYAGHGYLDEKTRRGYWLPVDAERENISNWIPTTDVTDTLAGVDARHALVVADSCFSGSLLRDAGNALNDPRTQLLQRLSSKKSRTVLTSGGLEPVLDDGDGKHSVFARVFLDALRENQGVLEAGRLFLQLRDRVTANADQTPQYAPIRNAGHEGGDFIFVRQ